MKTIILLACILMQSCNSQTKKNVEDKKQEVEKHTPVAVPFDLVKLTLNENINDILTAVNLSKKDTIIADFTTLLGNEKLVFGSDKVLIFNGEKLSGENGLGTNNVIFHYGKIDKEIGPLYNEKEDVVGMCQINLYSEKEIKNIIKELNSRFGKTLFEKTNEGNESDVVDNELVETSTKFKNTVQIWEKNNIIYYSFMDQTFTEKNIENSLKLFMFNKNDKNWASFISGKGFLFTEKIYNK